MTHATTAPRRRGARSRIAARFNWQGTVALLGLAAVWEVLLDTRIVQFEFLPAPSEILSAGFTILVSGALITDTVHTLTSTLVGWVIGSAIGIVVGLWFGLSAIARRFALATAEIFRAAPGIAFVPVIILLFGFTITTEIVTIIYVSVWPVLVNAVAGAQAVTPVHSDAAKTLHLSQRESIIKITLPTSLPYIATGMKLSLTTALALAVVVEMIGNPAGLGYSIIFHEQSLQPAVMLAVVIWVGLIGLALNVLFERLSLMFSAIRANRSGA